MSLLFGLRFDFRNPRFAGTTSADRYGAAIEMVEWGDALGCVNVTVSEHHGSPDEYLPRPLPVVAAMGARSSNVRFTLAALVAPFYEPLALTEEILVLDHLSRGRIDIVIAGGYVPGEFAMFDVPMAERGRRVTETVKTLKAAFSGKPFEFEGRTVHITPAPYRPGGPAIMLAGSSDAAARRAARIADGFYPSIPDVWDAYKDELKKLGRPEPGPCPLGDTVTTALSEDPEAAWEEFGPFFMHETNAYADWLSEGDGDAAYRTVKDIAALRELGQYQIVTPGQYVDQVKNSGSPFVMLHPLAGGTPPELAWRSLRLFEHEVLPAFS